MGVGSSYRCLKRAEECLQNVIHARRARAPAGEILGLFQNSAKESIRMPAGWIAVCIPENSGHSLNPDKSSARDESDAVLDSQVGEEQLEFTLICSTGWGSGIAFLS